MIYVRFYLMVLFTLFMVVPCHDAVAGFERMIVFGDSLSDTGNVIPVNQAKRWSGRFTNGPIYIDHLKSSLNLTDNQVHNYAFGGALSGPHVSFGPFLQSPVPSLTEQIDRFMKEQDPRSSDLVVLYAGANDYLGLFQNPAFYQLMASSRGSDAIKQFATNFQSHVDESVQNITHGMQILLNHGADSILIANLPDFSKTPIIKRITELFPNLTQKEVSNLERIMRQFSLRHNQSLIRSVVALQQELNPNQGIGMVDIFSSIETMLADPERYGFANTTDALNRQGDEAALGGLWFYADDIHPSAAVHYYLAKEAFDEAKKLSKEDTFLPLMAQLEKQTKSLILSPIQQRRLSQSLDSRVMRRKSPSISQRSIYAQLSQDDFGQSPLSFTAQSTDLEKKSLTFQEREKYKGSGSSDFHRFQMNYVMNDTFSFGAFTHLADSKLSPSHTLSHREVGVSGSLDYKAQSKTIHYLDWGIGVGKQFYDKEVSSHEGQSQNIFLEMGSLITKGNFLYGPLFEFSAHFHDRMRAGSQGSNSEWSLVENEQRYTQKTYGLGGQFFLPEQVTSFGLLSQHFKLGLTQYISQSQHAYMIDRHKASYKNRGREHAFQFHYEADLAFEKAGGLFFNLDFSGNKAHSRENQIQVHYALEF